MQSCHGIIADGCWDDRSRGVEPSDWWVKRSVSLIFAFLPVIWPTVVF